MDKLWKAAFAVGGLASVGAFIFWSLYKQWLTLSIFSALTANHTFILMLVFLALTFIAMIAMIIAFVSLKLRENVKITPPTNDYLGKKIEIATIDDIRKYDPRIKELEGRIMHDAAPAPPMLAQSSKSWGGLWFLLLSILIVLVIIFFMNK